MVKNLGIKIDRPETTSTVVEEVLEVIKSYLILDAGHFPFNPYRGIDKERYLFEWQDEETKNLQVMYFKERIKNVDSRISDVQVVITKEETHVDRISIFVKVYTGEEAVLELEM